MSNTIFSTTTRVLICKNCAAPIETPAEGGSFFCNYCGVQVQIVPRKKEVSLAPPQPEPISEEERLNRLRKQDGKPLLPPASLQSLFQGGRIPEWKIQEAVTIWQNTCNELIQSPSDYEAAERLYFLTMVLSNHYAEKKDPLRRRAMFEGALDAFSLPRHRQAMLGYLSRAAAAEGDLAASEKWLEPCDPRSDDLSTDSDYRVSRATLETAKGDWNAVLQAVGKNQTDVPIMDAMDGVATVLRANAWERLGKVDVAKGLLQQYMGEGGAGGRDAVKGVVENYSQWNLCQQSLAQAESQYAQQASQVAAARAGGGVGGIFFIIGILLLAGSAVGIVLTIVVDSGMFGMIPGMAIPGVIMFLLGRGMRKAAKQAAYLRAHGVSTKGTVVSLQPTGTRINNVPQYRITLSIELEGKAPYEAQTKLLLQPHDAAQLAKGSVLPVRVDPKNPQAVMLELD